MRTYFKYNEEMYYSYYKYYLNIIFKDGIKYTINANSKLICPYCGNKLSIIDENNWLLNLNNDSQFSNRLYLTHTNSAFNIVCKNPLYKYKLYITKELYQTCIGTFRTSPVYNQWHKYCRYNKYKIHNFKDYSDKEKKLVLKYNIDYSKEDEYEDGTLFPTVKYNKQKSKLQTGGQRSNGWKNKKIHHQWEINLKR